MMRILVVGAGATGGYYGGRLAQAGRDVTFLVRGSRMRQLAEDGLHIFSRQGDAKVEPKLMDAAGLASAGTFDLVLLSVKAYALESAIQDLRPAVGPNTVVLPVLNGMRHLDVLRQAFGPHRVMPGSVRIVADLDEQGRIHQLTELDELVFGESGGDRSQRAESLLQELTVPGYTAKLSENISAALWRKWWILATMGAVCVISGGTVGDVAAVPNGPELALAILGEAIAIATANGYPPNPEFEREQKIRITQPGSTLTSSMYRDMLKGAPVEADHILGDLLARAHSTPAPLLTAAYVRLKVYEAKRAQ